MLFFLLTTLLVLGEAPWLMSWWTMFSCPMNAATWMGVRPDCGGGDDKIDMTSMGNIIFALQKYWGTFGFDTGSGKVKKMWSSFLCSGLRVAKRIAKNKEKK